MTRKIDLELMGGVYSARGRREVRGQAEDYWKPVLCEEFIKVVAGMNGVNKIRVIVSDKAIGDGVEVRVQRVGYYRWSWRFVEEYYRFFNTSHGMYRGVEDILTSIFPNEWERDEDKETKAVIFLQEHGQEEEVVLWVRIESYEEVCDRD